MIRVGVAGLGRMGLLHAATVNAFPDAQWVAAAEPSGFIRRAVGSVKGDVHIHADFDKMLDKEKLDAVFITTPVFLHAPMIRACVERGVHFFVEKPLARSYAEVEPILQLDGAERIVSMVGYVLRYMETYCKGKEIIDSGVLGDIDWITATVYVSETFKEGGRSWYHDKEKSGGGVLIGLGSHVLDLLVWFFGAPTEVSGVVRRAVSRDMEDYAHTTLKFPQGPHGWLDVSWSVYNYRLPQSSIVIHGRNGQLMLSRELVRLFLAEDRGPYKKGWTELTKAELYRGVEFFIGGSEYTREDREFIDAIHGKATVNSDLAQGALTQRTIDRIYRSAESGRWEKNV